MKLRTVAALAVMSIPLCACSTLSSLESSTVSPKAIIVAANGLDGLISTATNYISLCTPNPAPAGCSDEAIQKLIPAVRSAQDARNNAETFVTAHPGQLGTQGLLDAVTTATSTIQQIVSEYNIKD